MSASHGQHYAMAHETLDDILARGARGLTGRYGFSDAASVTLLSESENKVYLVTDPESSQQYVIRANSGRLAYHTVGSVASELEWMMALRRDTDVVVPEVLRAADGSLVQTLSGGGLDKPRCAAVYTFLPGEEPRSLDVGQQGDLFVVPFHVQSQVGRGDEARDLGGGFDVVLGTAEAHHVALFGEGESELSHLA